MKRIWIAVGVLVSLISAIYLIGVALPESHRAAVRIDLDQPVEDVWDKVGALETWPQWNPSVTGVERVDDVNGNPVWIVHDRTGAMANEVANSVPPDSARAGKLVLRIADDSLPFGGSWTWDVRSTGAGTSVTLTENGEVYSPVFRFMSRFVFGHTATAESYLKALASSYGETSEPEVLDG